MPRSLPYSVFGFQGANAPPNIDDGVDGIHHSAISSQTVEVIRHLPDGVPEGIEGVRRHVSSRSVSRRHIQLQIGILESTDSYYQILDEINVVLEENFGESERLNPVVKSYIRLVSP